MAGTKPENTFIKSVHKHIHCYAEKMCNPFTSGTPDVWYSGDKGDLWVEYKFIPKIPSLKRTKVVPTLSPRQLLWLRQQHANGRNVAVIVGCKEGAVIFKDLEWEGGISSVDFRTRLITRAQTAQWLDEKCGHAVQCTNPPSEALDRDVSDV